MRKMIDSKAIEELEELGKELTPEVRYRMAMVIATLNDEILQKLVYLSRAFEYDETYHCARFLDGISFDYDVNVANRLGLMRDWSAIQCGATRRTRRQATTSDTLNEGHYYSIHNLSQISEPFRNDFALRGYMWIRPTQEEFSRWVQNGAIEVLGTAEEMRLLPYEAYFFVATQLNSFRYVFNGYFYNPLTQETIQNPVCRINRTSATTWDEVPVEFIRDLSGNVAEEMFYIDEETQETNPMFKWENNEFYVLGSDKLTYHKVNLANEEVEESNP